MPDIFSQLVLRAFAFDFPGTAQRLASRQPNTPPIGGCADVRSRVRLALPEGFIPADPLGVVVMYLRGLISASVFVVAFSSAALAQSDTFSPNTDRFGSDIRNLAVGGDPKECMSLCVRERQCRAWTYVKAGILGRSARCFFKNPVPAPTPNPCCTSGIKRIAD
jgi:hypothetical protein